MEINKRSIENTLLAIFFCLVSFALIVTGVLSSSKPTYTPPLGEVEGNGAVDVGAENLAHITEPDMALGKTVYTFTFTGVCTPGSLFGSSSDGTFNHAANESRDFFKNIRKILTADGCTVMPLGCVLASNEYDRVVKTEKPAYWLRGESSFAEILHSGGADLIPMMSEALYDYGNAGFAATGKAIADAGMTGISSSATVSLTVSRKTVTVRFINVNESNYASADSLRETVAAEVSKTDLMIVAVSGLSSLSREDASTLMRAAIDAGAAAAIGIDGGEIGESEKYGGGEIFYSLGTLIDGTGLSESASSLLLQLTVRESADGTLTLTSHTVECRSDVFSWIPEIISGEISN